MKPNKWFGLAAGMLLAWQCQADDFKLGYVNIERVYREATPALAIMKRLDQEFGPRREELKGLQAKGKKLEAQLVKPDLPDSERKSDQRELDAVIRDYNAKSASLSEDFNQRRAEEFAAFLQRANQAVRDIAEKGHYDLILQDSVYVSPKYDLTDTLLKALDQ
ncbi:OmpH family outer membrane protein [Paludibacterium purpuratum]|uniref:Periplasmic chaperone for outer membrane proteins Skp n=1 Tax=Paludibacterium purpuratum TaxID=1144873 RepID=A0A4R7B0A4_9NEIS|nr:OmpH family outer membrane protein [Paludibacterium purpuratum]TDR73844.1 periplasmic chaperone for outer membrane proteins Skp [Paludibacterium purpuratum]